MQEPKSTVLVVGASRGIGLEISNYLVKDYRVIACARSPRPATLERDIEYFEYDASDREKVAVDFLEDNNLKLDAIIYVAGISLTRETPDPMRFIQTVQNNLINPFLVISSLISRLSANSAILLISSINAHLAFPSNPGYVASKAGLDGLMRALSLDLSHIPCRVNSLSLGYFRTEMTNESFENPIERDRRSARTILGRWGKLSEIPPVAEFLISQKASYLTGQSIILDGGWTVKGL